MTHLIGEAGGKPRQMVGKHVSKATIRTWDALGSCRDASSGGTIGGRSASTRGAMDMVCNMGMDSQQQGDGIVHGPWYPHKGRLAWGMDAHGARQSRRQPSALLVRLTFSI